MAAKQLKGHDVGRHAMLLIERSNSRAAIGDKITGGKFSYTILTQNCFQENLELSVTSIDFVLIQMSND